MPHHHGRQRIEIDVPFATMPQGLILDMRVSHAAMRLWGVLFVLRWNGEPPDFPRLAEAMDGATERSVYRWLRELEEGGWIDWDRHADLQERFTLRTEKHGAKLTYRSNSPPGAGANLIVGSNFLTPESESLIQRSIFEGADGARTPQTDATQNHEKIQNGDGDESRASALEIELALVKRDFSLPVARAVAQMRLDPPTLIAFVDAMLDAGKSKGHIANRIRTAPPNPGERYEPHQRAQRAATGAADRNAPALSRATAGRDARRSARPGDRGYRSARARDGPGRPADGE